MSQMSLNVIVFQLALFLITFQKRIQIAEMC